EAWIVRFAGHAHRGRIVAMYGSVLSASFGAGPALIGWSGIDGWTPFVVGALVILAGVAPLTLVREERSAKPGESRASGLFAFAGKAPALLAAVGAFAILTRPRCRSCPCTACEAASTSPPRRCR